MGYSISYLGTLLFDCEMTAPMLGHLNTFLGEDRRDIGLGGDSAYETSDEYWYYINLTLTHDFSGLEWNEQEKTAPLHHIVNFLTRQMRIKWPDFKLSGTLYAQGEDHDDRWELRIDEEGRAYRVDMPRVGERITCPHCEQEFTIEGKHLVEVTSHGLNRIIGVDAEDADLLGEEHHG